MVSKTSVNCKNFYLELLRLRPLEDISDELLMLSCLLKIFNMTYGQECNWSI